MTTDQPHLTAQPGDLAQFIDPKGKKHILRLTPTGKLQTNHGQIIFSEIFGTPWGSEVFSHLKKPFILLQPSLHEILLNTKRATTIMYPKDISFILMNMNISYGQTILEAGTGSGALTTALSWAVGAGGRVISYDVRMDVQSLARKNIEKLGLSDRVTFKIQDIAYGFEETGVDALFLDVPNPEDYIPMVYAALKPGGYFGSLIPTTNQVSRLLEALQSNNFAFIEVCEIILRYYKPVPARLRPDDRLSVHTGFLVFGRPISWEKPAEKAQL